MSTPLKDWRYRWESRLCAELPTYELLPRLAGINPWTKTNTVPARRRRTRTMALTMVVSGQLADMLGKLR